MKLVRGNFLIPKKKIIFEIAFKNNNFFKKSINLTADNIEDHIKENLNEEFSYDYF